jgi:hypothetical protein
MCDKPENLDTQTSPGWAGFLGTKSRLNLPPRGPWNGDERGRSETGQGGRLFPGAGYGTRDLSLILASSYRHRL